MLKDPDSPITRTVKNEVIHLSSLFIMKGDGRIRRRLEIASSNTGSRITLLIDGLECPVSVFDDPERPVARSIRGDVIHFAAVIEVESETDEDRTPKAKEPSNQ